MPSALILTNIGLTKLATATPEDQITITHIAAGDGGGGYPPIDPDRTALVNEVWRGPASQPIRDSVTNRALIFEGLIPADIGGFSIREIGIFDGENDLIAIGQVELIEKPGSSPGSSPITLTLRVRILLENAAQTDLIISDAPYIDHQALAGRGSEDAHPMSAITGLVGALAGVLREGDFGLGVTRGYINDLEAAGETGFYLIADQNVPGAPDVGHSYEDVLMLQVSGENGGSAIQLVFASSSIMYRYRLHDEIEGEWSNSWRSLALSGKGSDSYPIGAPGIYLSTSIPNYIEFPARENGHIYRLAVTHDDITLHRSTGGSFTQVAQWLSGMLYATLNQTKAGTSTNRVISPFTLHGAFENETYSESRKYRIPGGPQIVIGQKTFNPGSLNENITIPDMGSANYHVIVSSDTSGVVPYGHPHTSTSVLVGIDNTHTDPVVVTFQCIEMS